MISADMRLYDYSVYGAFDDYGQQQLSNDIKGSVKMAIYTTSQSIQDNINYKNAQYIGLTTAKEITDEYVINYNGAPLKVLYINNCGRYKQVFMCGMNG